MDSKSPKGDISKNKKTDKISEEEATLFRSAMKKILPLKKTGKMLLKKPVIKRLPNENVVTKNDLPFLSDDLIEGKVLPEEHLFFARPGLSHKQIRRLRQGKIPIAGKLDLHGFDAESARLELIQYLEMAYRTNKRNIIIVHGKGHSEEPVLKNKINNWLRQIDTVLAFCTAIQRHGGAGAVYVMLKGPS